MNKELKDKSRQLSKLLRHKPEDLPIDKSGWVPIISIMKKLNISQEELSEIVETNDKKRFAIEGEKIRANQGHSIDIDLELKAEVPPFILYHGTGIKFLPFIINQGIKKMNRHHVHLSVDMETAIKVGSRHGKHTILEVKARHMHTDGIKFYKSENGVWLTDFIDPKYFVQL
jgi:putative RNA 2'-phosphotransferase